MHDIPLSLFDPRRGDPSFKLLRMDDSTAFLQPQRTNYFTVLWLWEGEGLFHVNLAERPFRAPALLFLSPFQTFFLTPHSRLQGVGFQFHANFYCIETHHEAVGCNGVLFNDVYGAPVLAVSPELVPEFNGLLAQMESEVKTSGVAQTEALVSYLKVFLIKATRLKLQQQQLEQATIGSGNQPSVLARLKQLIEEHYRQWHSPAEYAEALHMSAKALGKAVRSHLSKTVTELIRERLLLHAKWQLLHTRRSVKEIAWEVGFEDEYYFSRLFKRTTGFSPTAFREFETAIRGGSNLSM